MRSNPLPRQELAEAELELAKFSSIVASGNGDHALTRRGTHGLSHGSAHRFLVRAIHHDLQRAIDAILKFAVHSAS